MNVRFDEGERVKIGRSFYLKLFSVFKGNGVLWKPSDTALLSNYTIFKIMREAGVPAGVVNFVPALGPDFGDTITNSGHLAGINFTGSVP